LGLGFGLVESILPAIFWRQWIGWSYLYRSRRFRLVVWGNIKKNVTLSGKRRPATGLMVKCYGCYAYGFRFDSHLADFRIFSLRFFRHCLGITIRV